MNEAEEIVNRALARQGARDAAARERGPIDYDAANRQFRRQKAALTRAVNSGDPEKVVLAVTKAVQEWDEADWPWPDNWARWQRALDDALPFNQQVDLRDLT